MNHPGKPSDRIKVLCHELCAEVGKPNPTTIELMESLAPSIMRYLDEQYEAGQEAARQVARFSEGLRKF